jgi:hypothetical protein
MQPTPEGVLTEYQTEDDPTAGEIAGPAFLPLRRRPAPASSEKQTADDTVRTRPAVRHGRPAGERLRFVASP